MRHGEVFNPQGVLYGRLAGLRPLDLGARMAQAAADDLRVRVAPGRRADLVAAAAHAAVRRADRRGLRPRGRPRRARHRARRTASRASACAAAAARSATSRNWAFLVNPWEPSWGEPFGSIADPHDARPSTMRGTRSTGGDVVIVSHQLPIWMVHRRVAGKSPRARPAHAVAARSRASRRLETRGRTVRRGRLPRPRGRALAPRPPTWGRCDGAGAHDPRSPSRRSPRHPPCCSPAARATRSPTSTARAAARTTSPATAPSPSSPSRQRGEPIEFAGDTVERRRVRLRRHAGEVIVVNFWYAGCAPCRVEAPILEDVSASSSAATA